MEDGSSGPIGDKFVQYLRSLSAQTTPENVRTLVEMINDFRRGDRPYARLFETDKKVWKDNAAALTDDTIQVQGAEIKGPALADNIRLLLDEKDEAILEYENKAVEDLVTKAIGQDIDPDVILNHALIKAMDTVGKKFATGELFVPEMLMAANAMKVGFEILRPILTARKPTQRHLGSGHGTGRFTRYRQEPCDDAAPRRRFDVHDVGVNAAPDKIMAKAAEVNSVDAVTLAKRLMASAVSASSA
jgi:methanogenic corrinoid protein MtbC1